MRVSSGVLGLLSVGFLLFTLLTSNPFERLIPSPPDGADLNPLLQDPGLAIHPPLLYVGYVGFSVAFAFAVAAMNQRQPRPGLGQVDPSRGRRGRGLFLTTGIALGSWWAYYELGWGGWVVLGPGRERVVHAVAGRNGPDSFAGRYRAARAVQELDAAAWRYAAFSLSLLGTFLVRSGILVSVHAFAVDPERGLFILAFLAIVIGSALALYAWRAPSLDSEAGFRLLSRETFLLLNNVLLVIATALILGGTLSPLMVELFSGDKISVGPPYFEVAFAIPMVPLVLLVGVGMHTAWRSQESSPLLRMLKVPALLAVAAGVVVPLVFYGSSGVLLTVGVIAAFWIMAVSLIQPIRSWRRADGAVRIGRAALGMSIAHFGVGLFVLGVTIVSSFSVEADRSLRPGEQVSVAGYDFELRSLRNVQGPNYQAIEGEVDVRRDGEFVTQLRPQKRTYLVQQSPMTEAGIDAGWNRDIFVALGDPLGNNAWSVRLQYKPMIRFIWLGCLVMALGGIVAASDRRYRLAVRERVPSAKLKGKPA